MFLSCVIAASVVLVLALFVQGRRHRFDRRVVEEMAAIASTPAPAAMQEGGLPAPVERYRVLAVGDHTPVARTLVRHGGTFQMGPKAKPSAIRGVQIFSATPPGFLWIGRVRLAPGVWIDAQDRLAGGRGNMRVLLDDTMTLVDATGPHIDQGAALRLLAEMVWYPTALFDPRYVTWEAVDDERARATLQLEDLAVRATFTFGDDGFPASVSARRYHDSGELRPWGGTYSDWREVDGLWVPFEAKVSWELDQGTFTYAHWRMESFTYDGELAPSSSLEALLAPTGRDATQTKHGGHRMHRPPARAIRSLNIIEKTRKT